MPAKIGPKKSFRHFIAEHREAAKVTQEVLAGRLNTNVMTISRWENNKTRVDMPILAAVAEALGGDLMEAEDLLHHPNEPTPNQLLRRLAPDDRDHFLKQIKRAVGD